MSRVRRKERFEDLSVSEKILHVQELWDRIAADPDRVEVSEAQRRELDRRLAEHERDPQVVAPWAEVKARVRRGR